MLAANFLLPLGLWSSRKVFSDTTKSDHSIQINRENSQCALAMLFNNVGNLKDVILDLNAQASIKNNAKETAAIMDCGYVYEDFNYCDDYECVNRKEEDYDKEMNTLLSSIRSGTCGAVVNNRIKVLLEDINLNFVFEEDWLNIIFFHVLSVRFPIGTKSTSPNIYDFVELMTADFVFRSESDNLNIPRHLHLAIVSFVHNAFYGPDAVVPLTISDWIYFLGIKVQKYNLPLSITYLKHYEENEVGNYRKRSYPNIEFLSLKCQESRDLKNYEHLWGDIHNQDVANELGPALEMILKNALITTDDLNIEKSTRILYDCVHSQGYPVQLLEKVIWNEEVKSWAIKKFKNNTNAWFFRLLFRISGEPVTDALTYIWSCDFDHPFSLEEAQKLPGFDPDLLFFEVSRAKMPFLLQYDILSKFIKADLIPQDALPFCKLWKLPMFEILLAESNHYLNLFKKDSTGWNSGFMHLFDFKIISLIFETQISRNNPLAAILIFDEKLHKKEEYKSLVANKNFNLDVAYKIDFDINELSYELIFKIEPLLIIGREASFKKILNVLKNPFYYEMFGLNNPEDRLDNKKSTTVHSLKAFFENPNSIQ